MVSARMKKQEAEQAIRHLCHEWANLSGMPISPMSDPSFADFWSWLNQNFKQCVDFRVAVGTPRYHVESWFDHEMRQAWRN